MQSAESQTPTPTPSEQQREEPEEVPRRGVHFSGAMVVVFVTAAVVMAFRDCMA